MFICGPVVGWGAGEGLRGWMGGGVECRFPEVGA